MFHRERLVSPTNSVGPNYQVPFCRTNKERKRHASWSVGLITEEAQAVSGKQIWFCLQGIT
jgi:hypothetical protein